MILLINILLILIAPFLMVGVIKKTKAFWGGRKGASIFQPLFDFIKLMKKETVYSKTISPIFKIAPIISFGTVIFASLFVPLACGQSIINIPFAFVIFSYALGFGKFFSLISALDTGSSFEGMGASREACFSTIVEPAFFIALASVAVLTNISTFASFKAILSNADIYGYLIIALLCITLFIMLLVEGCRVPVDDPATHLELTMIHEVMVLDNSGADLGIIGWSAGIKIFLFEALMATLILPLNSSCIISTIELLGITTLISIIIGTVESSIARFRMTHIFEFIFIMSITALLILTLVTYKIFGN